MKVLIVGGGGREHAIAVKLKESPLVTQLYCAPGNGGTAAIATNVDIKATDVEGVVRFSREQGMDFVVVAPDDPLMLGMVDALNEVGIPTFGPRKNAAIIEGSKAFSKELMKKYHIPTAEYEVFTDSASAIAYVKAQGKFPTVIKADGLALGKGVIIAQNLEEAETAIHDMMDEGRFGQAGSRVVIEEFLTGPEISVLAFCDGKTVRPMVSAQDHKRAFDEDKGPNTGGMGTFSPSKVYTPEVAQECMENIFLPTVRAMQAEGRPFSGCLYFGLMKTPQGVKVIEYNSRFGDPETQVVLPRLKSDLMEIFLAIWRGELDQMEIEWEDNAAVCVVMASGGYPGKYTTGYPITGLEEAEKLSGCRVYHAGTRLEGGQMLTNGGRVLGVTRIGSNLEEAIRLAYEAVDKIDFQDKHFRRDIGVKK
ncbi:MAG: phosphoribosylamine--glycine ligase [Eubacteriales bacterium]